jgi:hypothetical protein
MAEGVGCARSLRELRLPSVAERFPHAYCVRKVLIQRSNALQNACMAEGVGFEPTSPFGEAVFKTAALNHSAIPPQSLQYKSFCYSSSSYTNPFSSTTKE